MLNRRIWPDICCKLNRLFKLYLSQWELHLHCWLCLPQQYVYLRALSSWSVLFRWCYRLLQLPRWKV